MLKLNVEKKLVHKTLQIELSVGREIIAIVGPSGAGKTTVLNMIAGIVTPQKGDILFEDHYFIKNGKTMLKIQQRKIGYVFQDYALFPHKTVWENIAYSMVNKEKTMQMIQTLEMEHLLEKYPHEISGGEKQRTALLRAYATEPNILLLDEPFSALDDETKQISYTQLRTLHKYWKIPVILVTHNEQEMERVAHKAYRLENEQLVKILHNV